MRIVLLNLNKAATFPEFTSLLDSFPSNTFLFPILSIWRRSLGYFSYFAHLSFGSSCALGRWAGRSLLEVKLWFPTVNEFSSNKPPAHFKVWRENYISCYVARACNMYSITLPVQSNMNISEEALWLPVAAHLNLLPSSFPFESWACLLGLYAL